MSWLFDPMTGSGTFNLDDRDEETPLLDDPKGEAKKNTCWGCSRELSSYLDAYHGREPNGEKYCDPCRRRLNIP